MEPWQATCTMYAVDIPALGEWVDHGLDPLAASGANEGRHFFSIDRRVATRSVAEGNCGATVSIVFSQRAIQGSRLGLFSFEEKVPDPARIVSRSLFAECRTCLILCCIQEPTPDSRPRATECESEVFPHPHLRCASSAHSVQNMPAPLPCRFAPAISFAVTASKTLSASDVQVGQRSKRCQPP